MRRFLISEDSPHLFMRRFLISEDSPHLFMRRFLISEKAVRSVGSSWIWGGTRYREMEWSMQKLSLKQWNHLFTVQSITYLLACSSPHLVVRKIIHHIHLFHNLSKVQFLLSEDYDMISFLCIWYPPALWLLSPASDTYARDTTAGSWLARGDDWRLLQGWGDDKQKSTDMHSNI